jgi:hypothetical protein
MEIHMKTTLNIDDTVMAQLKKKLPGRGARCPNWSRPRCGCSSDLGRCLTLGNATTGSGTYDLSGTGSLSANFEYIGNSGIGAFTQSGGTHIVANKFSLGEAIDGNGTYDLSGGSLAVDDEYVGKAGTGALTQSGGTNTLTGTLFLGDTSTGSGTFNLSGSGSLSVGTDTIVGNSGLGAFTQSSGTHVVANTLTLGNATTGSGTYDLSGTGSLSANFEYIGNSGIGAFTQSGGTNMVGVLLNLGNQATGSGAYELGNGSLTADSEIIGNSGIGVFTQFGGTHTVTGTSTFVLGNAPAGFGSYDLSDGSLVAVKEIIGNSGNGIFTQSGGTNVVSNTLTLAKNAGSNGTYDLQGGSLYAPTTQVNANGAFTQDGGNFDGTLTNLGDFNYNGGVFAGRLVNFGAFNFSTDFTAGNGMANFVSLTIPVGYTFTMNGLGFDNSGILNLHGTLTGSGPLVNNLVMSAEGTIAGTGGFTNNGLVTQSGGPLSLFNTGTNTNYGQIAMAASQSLILGPGVTLDNQGQLILQNLSLITGTGTLNNSTGVIQFQSAGSQGTINSPFANGGELQLTGGSLTVTQNFSNSGLISLNTSDAVLQGAGLLTNTGTIQGQGTIRNNLSNSGDLTPAGGNMTLTGTSITNNTGAQITVPTGLTLFATNGVDSNAGTILYNGTFNNNNQPLSNTGFISGSGTWASGTLTNAGTFQMLGGTTLWTNDVNNQPGGSFQITNTTVNFIGSFNNSGTVKTTSAAVTFTGGFINNGAYISDPSVQTFSDLTIGSAGYLTGGAGDVFQISNNFVNQSTQNTLWNTVAATLQFTTGTDITPTSHDFYIPGTDYGATTAGYPNNFSWGTLNIAGQTVHLMDGSGSDGGALYVETISGVILSGLTATNIVGAPVALNIYYDPTQIGNEYLMGLTYAFASGSGHLIPTPIPASVLLLGSGLLGLGLLGRRRKRS